MPPSLSTKGDVTIGLFTKALMIARRHVLLGWSTEAHETWRVSGLKRRDPVDSHTTVSNAIHRSSGIREAPTPQTINSVLIATSVNMHGSDVQPQA